MSFPIPIPTVLIKVSVTVMKICHQKQVGKGLFYPTACSPPSRELRAEMKGDTEAESVEECPFHGLLS